MGEVKHLSTPRKIEYSLSSGERTGISLNRLNSVILESMFKRGSKTIKVQFRMSQEVTNRTPAEGPWKGPPQEVIVS